MEEDDFNFNVEKNNNPTPKKQPCGNFTYINPVASDYNMF